jgi:hypothetical protein
VPFAAPLVVFVILQSSRCIQCHLSVSFIFDVHFPHPMLVASLAFARFLTLSYFCSFVSHCLSLFCMFSPSVSAQAMTDVRQSAIKTSGGTCVLL